MRIRRLVVIATAGATAGAGLVAGILILGASSSGSAPPSAQCRSQLHQVAVLQADARNIQNSSVAVANGQLARFNSDVGTSSRLLKLMKSEGCPDGGY